ncbi:MAG: GntR family transcriptional regulator [Bryobacteraceae bacterium]|nr:GntR family transcriptional regulator [Bryobacteraceae bacterium]
MPTARSPHFSPVLMRAANLQVHEKITDSITGGQFEPGDTLSTRHFAELLGVSQMPVREAFHRLVAEGALENRPNRTIGLPVIERNEFEDLTEIRYHMEGLAAKKAAKLISAEELAALERIAYKMEHGRPRGTTEYLLRNREFHFGIYRASQSDSLFRLIAQIWLRVGPLLNWSSRQAENVTHSVQFHRQALDALAARDGAAARAAIVADLKEAADLVLAQLAERHQQEARSAASSAK